MTKLSLTMTLSEFDNGYWYAQELKDFANRIGIPHSSTLRKDELEWCIRHFLQTGEKISSRKISSSKSQLRDEVRGLSLKLPVIHYTSNKTTKAFIQKEALKISPHMPNKSGARYWLNRWREEQLEKGKKITYGDLVKQFVKLNTTQGRLPRIPSTKFNNFIADFLEANREATRTDAVTAWEELKRMNLPKTFKAWDEYQKSS